MVDAHLATFSNVPIEHVQQRRYEEGKQMEDLHRLIRLDKTEIVRSILMFSMFG